MGSDDDDTPKKKKSKTEKKERTKKKRAAEDAPEASEKRARTEEPEKRPRTRSMDERERQAADREAKLAYFAEHAIVVEGADAAPMTTFASAPFNDAAQRRLRSQGFEEPTPTQAVSWPLALAGRDLISVAKTGSGKTLGFLLPAFHKMWLKPKEAIRGPASPQCVVLAPTRELATQIGDEAAKFCSAFDVRCCTVYGGAPKWEQSRQLRTVGARACVVGTPGRVNDFLDGGKISLAKLETLVLDEGDRMLDMGFEPQIRSVVSHVDHPVQTLLFTATWDKKVQRVASTLVDDSKLARVVFGDAASGKLVANKDITQTIELVENNDKRDATMKYLDGLDEHYKLIVFVSTKRGCDELCRELKKIKVKCDALHGDRDQWDRDRIISNFRTGKIVVLCATDVAARGLDIADVTHVLNYDFPAGTHGVEDYVHRIGRTGRAGNKGNAHTLFTRGDKAHANALIQILTDAEQSVPDALTALAPRGKGKGGRGRGGFGTFSRGRGGRGRGGFTRGRGAGFGGRSRPSFSGSKKTFD